jgi:hypothetical protein
LQISRKGNASIGDDGSWEPGERAKERRDRRSHLSLESMNSFGTFEEATVGPFLCSRITVGRQSFLAPDRVKYDLGRLRYGRCCAPHSYFVLMDFHVVGRCRPWALNVRYLRRYLWRSSATWRWACFKVRLYPIRSFEYRAIKMAWGEGPRRTDDDDG